ncbi:hypothetical protein F5X98DRAFT_391488 [Xylaria grammica]|nr:hypothetical protein F5X98DRAFT_391488 [Xylaria grammica]
MSTNLQPNHGYHLDTITNHLSIGASNDTTSAVPQRSLSSPVQGIPNQQIARGPHWLPYTLRGQSMSGIIAFTCILEILIITLHAISTRNTGLVDDDDSDGLIVISKFLPTLLAVIYVLLLAILLDDVKRTEPFAHLALPSGAPANISMTWTADAWWNTLLSSLPNRSKKTDWTLLCATLVSMLGSLVVSPLSSTLILSQDVVFTRPTQFSQIDITPDLPLQVNPRSTTYFRTISNILQNVTTSAWLTDKYVVLPFWPAEMGHAPLGPIIPNRGHTWVANTTVFSTDLDCEDLELNSIKTILIPFQKEEITVDLSSQSGCMVELRMKDSSFPSNGGMIWATIDNKTVELGQNDTTFPSLRDTMTTNVCPQNELFIATTPLANYTRPDFQLFGISCRASYYMGNTLATVSLGEGRSVVTIDEPQYLSTRRPIPNEVLNLPSFDEVFFNSNWTVHLDAEGLSRYFYPAAYGPANILSALYDFSPRRIIGDKSSTANMHRIQHRFLAEIFRDTFAQSSNHAPVSVSGNSITSVRRLVVVPAIAITLEVVIGVQLILLALILTSTRIIRRPLGLKTDPAPVISLARLVANDPGGLQRVKNLYNETTKELGNELSNEYYKLVDGEIRLSSNNTASASPINTARLRDNSRLPRSRDKHRRAVHSDRIFSLWALVILSILLTGILIALAILYWRNNTYGLYQTPFVYSIKVSVKGLDLGSVNPASIITTLTAVIVGLWWSSIDTTLRRVQPFLALAKEPAIGAKGVCVSYRSSYLLWAAYRGAKRRHWVMALVCTGAFLAQIFTIAMSSLWSLESGTINSSFRIPRKLQLRHVPRVSAEPAGELIISPGLIGFGEIFNLLSSMRTSWIYGAAIQLSLGGSKPPWSSNGWSFVPSDLSLIPRGKLQNVGNQTAFPDAPTAVVLETQAIRARLECSPYGFISNISTWATRWDLTDGKTWDLPESPDLISHGYELGLLDSYNTGFLVNKSSAYHTTIFADSSRLQCCENITDGKLGPGSVGYWSPNTGSDKSNNFTVKWIHGYPVEGYQVLDPYNLGQYNAHLMWADEPQMAALNCMPLVETANASVTVDAEDGRIIEFDILDIPRLDEFAWIENFVPHQRGPRMGAINVTTSHGILFLNGLLRAADIRKQIIPGNFFFVDSTENVRDETFTIRDPGLNVDLMSYSMLSLVGNDHRALLDPGTLERTAKETFTVLFQHFANYKVSLDRGGYVYQSLTEELGDIGPSLLPNNTPPPIPPNLPRYIDLQISHPVELLRVSMPAIWVCLVILAYLLPTCVAIAIASREYNKLLPKNINSIADVAVLVAGSERLLTLARENSTEDSKHNPISTATLGWFRDDCGELRLGIEHPDMSELEIDSLLEYVMDNDAEEKSSENIGTRIKRLAATKWVQSFRLWYKGRSKRRN